MKIFLILVGFLLISVGCSPQQQIRLDRNNPTVVKIWHYYSGEQRKAFDRLIAEFNYSYGKENGIIVEAETTADIDLLIDELKSSFDKEPGSRELPDAFFTYSDSAYPLAINGHLASFNDYLDEKDLFDFVDGFITEGKLLGDDDIYIMPVAKATEVVMLNKTDFDLFLEENPTFSREYIATWEGISAVAEAYHEWSGGKSFFGIDVLANFIFVSSKQNGVDIVDNINGEGIINIDEDVMRKIWEIYYINTLKGYFGAFNNFRSDDVKTGDLLAYLGSTASGAYFPAVINIGYGVEYPIEMETFMMPIYEDGTKVAIQQGAGIAMVNSTPEREYAVSMFIKWFTEPDRNIRFALAASYLPVTKEAIEQLRNDDELIREHVPNEVVLSVLKVAVSQIDSGYNMFLTKPFEGSYEVRMTLQTALREYTERARNSYLNDLENGESNEEALDKYIGESNFEEFLRYMTDSVL